MRWLTLSTHRNLCLDMPHYNALLSGVAGVFRVRALFHVCDSEKRTHKTWKIGLFPVIIEKMMVSTVLFGD